MSEAAVTRLTNTQAGAPAATLPQALDAAVNWLLRDQKPEGFWIGMVETNSSIEAEWLLAAHILGTELPMTQGLIRTLLNRQRPDGSWDIYPGAPAGDINSTVEVYAALRVTGHERNHPALTLARNWILTHGGLRNVRVFTRYWLAMIGVWPWRYTANLPPEVMRLPLWFPFNIYNFAQWARATLVPLAILSARRPVQALPDGSRLEELFPEGIDAFDFDLPAKSGSRWSLEGLFGWFDKVLHQAQTLRLIPLRETAIKLCLEWIVRHQDGDGAWGGIQPPWIYGLIALRTEGYGLEHPVVAKGLAALSSYWSYERDGSTHIQATESSVWDTLFGALALCESGHTVENSPALRKATQWILNQQILTPGDWSVTAPNLPPGGWAFERSNTFYPDVDDTALALLVLSHVRRNCGSLLPRVERAIERGVVWALGMQSANGGWAAFDRDNTRQIISAIPFCNFGEALDPPSVDVTAHLLEALASLGFTTEHPAVRRGLEFIRSEQEADGGWFGRWGVNYIYGIGAVLPALQGLGEDMSAAYIRKAAGWLVQRQNADGGWGESCASYMVASAKGRGASTPSQTAWALLSLQAVDAPEYRAAVDGGLSYLIRNLTAEGTWSESAYTGTGFPGYGVGSRVSLDDPRLFDRMQQGAELSRGFMIGYNLYRHYFPLLALARARSRSDYGQPAVRLHAGSTHRP
jgi:squalene-hopene/tetraprenyl-beta-curcumene cyclase